METKSSARIFTVILFVFSCSKKPATTTESDAEGLTASLASSQKIGIAGSAEEGLHLYGLAPDPTTGGLALIGNIFNSELQIHHVFKTSGTIVVAGDFSRFGCYLVAFSRTSLTQKVRCLSKLPVGTFSPTLGKSNAHYAKAGIRQRGESLYFVANDERGSGESYLHKWSDGDSAPETLLTKPFRGTGFEDVFLHDNGTNICALAPAIMAAGGLYNGQLFCGSEAGGFTDVSAGLTTTNSMILAETFQHEGLVVSTDRKLDLATLAASARTANGSNGGLPSGYANRATLPAGGLVARAYAGSVSHFSSNGDTTVLADLNGTGLYFHRMLNSGAYAWVTGGTDLNDEANGTALRRITLAGPTMPATDYLTQTGLVKINHMGYLPDGTTIVLKGLKSGGDIGYATIDSAGTIAPLATAPSGIFLSLLNL